MSVFSTVRECESRGVVETARRAVNYVSDQRE
jgi:hypothetical protein